MKNQLLLNRQKNELLSIILNNGFDRSEFKWQHFTFTHGNELGMASEYACSNLIHKDGYFKFNFNGFNYFPEFAPGRGQRTESLRADSWGFVKKIFTIWLENLRSEKDEPDLWSEFDKFKQHFNINAQSEYYNEKFSDEEKSKIILYLDKFKNEIVDHFNLVTEQNDFIIKQNLFLIEALDRSSKRDWWFLFLGVLASNAFYIPELMNNIPKYFFIIQKVFQIGNDFIKLLTR